MPFSFLLALALAAPAALYLLLLKRGKRNLALPLTALAVAAALISVGGWLVSRSTNILLSQPEADQTYHLTYYAANQGHFLMSTGFIYLAWATVIALVQWLDTVFERKALPFVFGLFHLGTALTSLLYLVPPIEMPRRYVDYPEAFRLINQISGFALQVTVAAVAALGLLLISAVSQRIWAWRRA